MNLPSDSEFYLNLCGVMCAEPEQLEEPAQEPLGEVIPAEGGTGEDGERERGTTNSCHRRH